MSKIDGADRCLARSAYLLSRIAAALDCSIEAFLEPLPDEITQTVELMPLWLTIEHERDRMKVLSIVRSVAPTMTTQQTR
jgi:hypothetical protein